MVLFFFAPVRGSEAAEPGRLRVIVETDAGGDPDDEQSLVRFLVYANEFDVEGIVANRPAARDGENRNPVRDGLGIVRAMIRAYGSCHANLVRHDPRFPPADALLERTVAGYDGVEDGVNLILRAVDAPDPRPVWFCNWGTDRGSAESCLKRALDRVLRERGVEGYAAFKRRLRLSSADKFGDHTAKIDPPFPLFVDTLRPELGGRRWYHRFSSLTATAGGFDLERDVRTGHGPLGALYPTNTGLRQKEGDTMMFLYLVPTGMNDPAEPGWGSWAGRYGPHGEHAGRPYYWANRADAWEGTTNRDHTVARWAAALQNDFRARMDWCATGEYGKANHPPSAVLNGDRSKAILRIAARPGERVSLSAAGSSDPDGHAFSARWFVYPEAGTFGGEVPLERDAGEATGLRAPAVEGAASIHVILQIADTGGPPLCAWRRAVIEVAPVAAERAEAASGKPPAGVRRGGSDADAIGRLIERAGQATDEGERLRLLRELEARTDLDDALRTDLARLLPVAEDWAGGSSRAPADDLRAAENGYLCRFITGQVVPSGEGPAHPPEVAGGSPLRPLWCLYRGRMLVWRVVQSGPLLRVKETRDRYYGEARRLLEEARRAYPANPVIAMYLGVPIPWAGTCAPDGRAPAWANLQREGLEKLADVIHWWIAERQLPDGQFGGGWGDDVEMWRWWTPVLIAFEDPQVNAAQERLSAGIFRRPHLREGFTSRLTDVEHSNEDTTDTILPMMHLKPDDPEWRRRALRLAGLMRDRWTGRNEQGRLQFKSIYFSVDRVDTRADRAFDTVYHPSAVQPALLCWQRSGDPALTALFGEWLKTWVDAAARAENGKPAGVLPPAVRWPDGGIGKTDRPWWEPFSPGHNDALYNWPGATRLMTSTLLLAHHMTGEASYLDPLRSMAALRLKHRDAAADSPPGSEAWCARNMGGFLPDALAKLRLLTGDTRYDAILRADASGYVRFRLTGDRAPLEAALLRHAEAFRSNREGYTSEMRWTDRVMSFTRNYLAYLPEAPPPAPAPEILYSSATGDPGNPLVFPLNAVRWRTPPRGIAALVTESGRDSLAAELFHFGPQPRDLEAEFFLLRPGDYDLTVIPGDAGRDGAVPDRRTVRLAGPGTQVALRLPPRRLCTVRMVRRRE